MERRSGEERGCCRGSCEVRFNEEAQGAKLSLKTGSGKSATPLGLIPTSPSPPAQHSMRLCQGHALCGVEVPAGVPSHSGIKKQLLDRLSKPNSFKTDS